MCRLLYANNSHESLSISDLLPSFAELAKNSREFQGHGWGCAWLDDHGWHHYHNILPVWKDDLTQFGRCQRLLVHARSAFRDEGIVVENNMPFSVDESVFIFNGELHGVRIKAEGRIGAEKIFNYIRRFDKGDKLQAVRKAVEIIDKRSSYVRAMNFILADANSACLSSSYNENPDYFQMHQKHHNNLHLVCSEPFPGETDWTPIENKTTTIL